MNPNKNPNNFTPIFANNLSCINCDYKCCKQSDWNRHILTRKHKTLTQPNNLIVSNTQNTPRLYTCKCGKQYKHRSTLSQHKKLCTQPQLPTQDDVPYLVTINVPNANTHINIQDSPHDDLQIQTNLILELVKQNQEFKELLIQQSNQLLEQNKQLYETHEVNMDLQKQLLEVVKDGKTINNTINTSNSHNKTFNLQVFLNETCKDAMNIKDFIQSLELNLTDLEKVGELGYAEGISRMFIKGLNSLDITKRPIHCSDVKREIMHIKHEDKWEKDNANQDKLKNIIKQLTHKNIMMLDDWKKANPGCTEYNSKKYDRYLKLTLESMGPTDDDAEKRDFNKIIRRVAENTTIDKKYLVV
jgi:hypothetical protein